MAFKSFIKRVGERIARPFVSVDAQPQVGANVFKALMPKWLYKPPYGYPRMVNIPELRRIAKTPAAYMCVQTIVDQVASAPFEIISDRGNEAHVKEVEDFFYNPNSNEESFTFLRKQITIDILEIDSGVFVKVFDRVGRFKELLVRDGGTFTKNPDKYGMLPEKDAYYQYSWVSGMGAKPIPFDKNEIVYISRNPRTDGIYGISPPEILYNIIQSLVYGYDYNLEYFTQNNIPKGVLQLLGASEPEMLAFRERFEKYQVQKDEYGHWRKYFHRVPMTNQEIKFLPFSLSSKDLELIASQQWFHKIVWACFGVTPSELGFTENSNKATDISQSKVFKRKAVRPVLDLLEYHINTQIIPEFNFDDIRFKFIHFDLGEELEKHKLYEVQLRTGLKTINEIRTQEDLEPVEWGEEPYKFGGRLEQGFREMFSPTGKSFTTASPLIPKEGEGIFKPKKIKPSNIYNLILQFNKDKEEEILKELERLSKTNMLSQIKDLLNANVEVKKVVRRGNKWCVIHCTGAEAGKIIKCFPKKEKAEAMHRAIMASKKDLIIEGKSLITEFIDKINKMMAIFMIKDNFDSLASGVYLQGMEKLEKQLNRNFVPNKDTLEFLKKHTFGNIKDMNDETANDLRGELERGVINGEGIPKLKERVKSVFKVSNNRAEKIARTEMTRITNLGFTDAVVQSGLKGEYEWVSTMDDRTTDICKHLNGQRVKIGEKFKYKDWEGFAPPANVNCRSRLIFHPEVLED